MGLSAEQICSEIEKNGILPVVCLKTEEELRTFIQSLISTPVRCVEITMRHEFSCEAIRYIKETHPDFVVGAGTVVNTEILNEVEKLGVDFCVSPGFDEEVVSVAKSKNITFIPGCATPSDLLIAQKHNIDLVKFFPSECFGGVRALKLYEGAFSGISFLPTGGIDAKNYIEYIRCSNVIACGGSFMIPKDLLKTNDVQGICDIVNGCVSAIKESRK